MPLGVPAIDCLFAACWGVEGADGPAVGPTVVLAALGGKAKTEAGLGLLVLVPTGAAAFAMSGDGPDACPETKGGVRRAGRATLKFSSKTLNTD